MSDLIPTLLFPSNIHQSGTLMRLFFTFTFIVRIIMVIMVMMTAMMMMKMIVLMTVLAMTMMTDIEI